MINFFLFLNLIFLQDFDLNSKSLSPLLLNNNLINQNIQNQSSHNVLENRIDPDLYIVGPGDKFYLSFSANNFSFNNYLTVSPVGDIIIPSIGLVNLNKLILKDAYSIIIEECKNKYSNVEASITLTDVRKFYVNVYGLNYIPSKVLVSPIHTVADAFLVISEKINNINLNNISKRHIVLKRNNKSFVVDVLRYRITGDNYNPTLIEGDEIHLSSITSYVDIYGGVINPGRYELVENENLDEFILIAGGLTENSSTENIEISRFNDLNNEYKLYVNKSDFIRTSLKSYDHIIIPINSSFRNRNLVSIKGEINTPGYYVIDDDMTFNDLLSKAGGYTDKADSSRLMINNKFLIEEDLELKRINLIPPQKRSMSEISYVKSRTLVKKGVISSNNKSMTKQILNYNISSNDEIIIPSIYSFVDVIGGVKNPGRYPHVEGFTITDYINEAGGLTDNAKNKFYLINSLNQKKSINKRYSDIYNGETIFIQTKEDFNVWNKFVEILGPMGQLATLIAVIQSASD